MSADDINDGDATIFREKWTGFGKYSGLPGIKGTESKTGLLQNNAGGTIFVDEMHSLDKRSLNYMRKILDREEIPLAVGQGKPIKPDVRLIFATFEVITRLHEEKILPDDFVRRIGDGHLIVPPLSRRREDILLFVEKYREDCRSEESFLLGLLYHDWPGQVHQLIVAINRAVVKAMSGKKRLELTALQGVISDSLFDRLTSMNEKEIGIELYTYLIDVLEQQGFSHGRRGSALNKRLADLLGVSPSQLSNRLDDLGLRVESTHASKLPMIGVVAEQASFSEEPQGCEVGGSVGEHVEGGGEVPPGFEAVANCAGTDDEQNCGGFQPAIAPDVQP